MRGLLLFMTFCKCVHGVSIESQTPRELQYRVKAAFLYSFAEFVTWPTNAFPTADSPIIIGVFGTDPFGPILDDTVRGKVIDGRPIVLKRFQEIDQVKRCQRWHMLFISKSEHARLSKVFAELRGRNILTVGESEQFAAQGGMIQFFEQENRVRFTINLTASKLASLSISSKLLRVAARLMEE